MGPRIFQWTILLLFRCGPGIAHVRALPVDHRPLDAHLGGDGNILRARRRLRHAAGASPCTRLFSEGLARRRMARDHRFQHRHESVRIQHELQLLWRAHRLCDRARADGPVVLAGVKTARRLGQWSAHRCWLAVHGVAAGLAPAVRGRLAAGIPAVLGADYPAPHVVLQARRMGDGGRAAPVRARDGSAAVLQPYSLWCVA